MFSPSTVKGKVDIGLLTSLYFASVRIAHSLNKVETSRWQRKHLVWKNIWRIIWRNISSSPFHKSVCSAINHLLVQANLKSTWWFTVERNYTNVLNVINPSIKLEIWKGTFSLIQGISCTIVNNAACHLVQLESWKDTCSLILGRSCTIVHNAASHLVMLEVWKDTCLFILERSLTSVSNATTQPLNLVI